MAGLRRGEKDVVGLKLGSASEKQRPTARNQSSKVGHNGSQAVLLL